MCNSLGWIRRGGLLIGNLALLAATIPGCQASRKESATEVFKVQIDRHENGAAEPPANREFESEQQPPSRRLAFEVTGFGQEPPSNGLQERRAAAQQAAIIDAFGKALIEARRSSGQSTSNFTAKLGQRLTVTHRPGAGGEEFAVRLISGGVEKRFVVRDGVLQHLPHDFKLIHEIFDETRGEFSLLPTGPAASPGTFVANVGYYLPVAPNQALAGGPDATRGE